MQYQIAQSQTPKCYPYACSLCGYNISLSGSTVAKRSSSNRILHIFSCNSLPTKHRLGGMACQDIQSVSFKYPVSKFTSRTSHIQSCMLYASFSTPYTFLRFLRFHWRQYWDEIHRALKRRHFLQADRMLEKNVLASLKFEVGQKAETNLQPPKLVHTHAPDSSESRMRIAEVLMGFHGHPETC